MALPGKKQNEPKIKETVPTIEMKPALPAERPVEAAPVPEPTVEAPSEAAEAGPAAETVPAPPVVAAQPSVAAAPSAPPPVEKDAMTKEIEEIMEEDLTDLFLKMTPDEQAKFKQEGEIAAGKIRLLVAAAKVQTKKILKILVEWLKLIPGVNKFFLEQEAKIKTDKILIEAEDQKRQGLL